MKPLYTEVFTLKISSTQKRTLEKLKSRNIKVSDFVRKAISPYIPVIDKKTDENYMKKYFEAEEKTFKNPLIFVKK